MGEAAVLRAGACFGLCLGCAIVDRRLLGLLAFEALVGVGASLLSGADLALLYDTERELQQDKPERANRGGAQPVCGRDGRGRLASMSATGLLSMAA